MLYMRRRRQKGRYEYQHALYCEQCKERIVEQDTPFAIWSEPDLEAGKEYTFPLVYVHDTCIIPYIDTHHQEGMIWKGEKLLDMGTENHPIYSIGYPE